ncbi:MAG: 4-hydroxybenzoyl-CoA reductase subunit beta [Myxococcales bacterium]|nr:4-hydroxybenzoyl-CoA reductase subunit beta [Myxococcales bacterium]
MLPLPTFEYAAPTTVLEASRLLGTPGSRLVAGGTDLLVSMKHRLFEPRLLVSTRRLGLRGVSVADGVLSVGAGTTLREVARHPTVLEHLPSLAAACRTVATPTIQGMATLGGNLMLDTRCLYYNQPAGWRASLGYCLKREGTVCHVAPKGRGCYAAHSADTVPALWLLGAEAEFVSVRGVRRIPVSSMYHDDGMAWLRLEPDDVLTAVHVPLAGRAVGHRKLRTRQAIDYALVLVAVRAPVDGGLWSAVVSSVSPSPIFVEAATPADLAEAAFRACQPLSTHLPAATWRKKMVRVEVARAAAALTSA